MRRLTGVVRTFGMFSGALVLLAGTVLPATANATIIGEVTYQGNYALDQEWDEDDGELDGICHDEVYNPETDEDEEVVVSCGMQGDDSHSEAEELGFDFDFYGQTYDEAYQNINGVLHFECPTSEYSNEALPTDFDEACEDAAPAILAFWDDIITAPKNAESEEDSGYYPTVLYRTVGTPGSQKFIAQWTNMYLYSNPTVPVGTFQIILYEGSNNIQLQYRNLLGDPERSSGSSATVGIQYDSELYSQYSSDTADSLHPEMAILYSPDGEGGYDVDDEATYNPVFLSIPGQPAKPVLRTPDTDATDVARQPVFRWYPAENADSYVLTVAVDEGFSDIVFQGTDLQGTSYTWDELLDADTTYYWTVKALNGEGEVFSDIWTFETGSTVEDEPFVDDSLPNGGDLNDDGTFDGDQPNVSSFLNSLTDKYAVLEVSDECSISDIGMRNESDLASQDSGYAYPNGLMHFDVSCGDPGFTATVSQYYYDVSMTGLSLRKFNPNTNAFFMVNGAAMEQLTIDGHTITKVTYQVTDGGELDMDGEENGVIVDPAGLASLNVSAPNTGLGGSARFAHD